MSGGQSAIRHPPRSNGLISTVGSRSDTPPPGTEQRSCNASQTPAALGSLSQSPWAFVLWEASDRQPLPASPTPAGPIFLNTLLGPRSWNEVRAR